MKSNELRIGNLVILKKDFYTYRKGNVFKLSNVGIDYLDRWQDMGSSDELRITDVEPIPLTEEWLVKFGFEKAEWKGLYHKDGLFIWWYNERQSVMLHKCQPYNVNYKHVHTLQNLYFALTGEELQCKE